LYEVNTALSVSKRIIENPCRHLIFGNDTNTIIAYNLAEDILEKIDLCT
jgi:hypothetical protein